VRLATCAQMKEIDALSVSAYGLSGDVLMEAAGTLAAREIQLLFFPELGRGHVAVVCGPGNNGGDGLVVARHLHSQGFRNLTIYTLAPEQQQSDLFKVQLRRAELCGLRVEPLYRNMAKAEALKGATLIVDALFGVGLQRNLTGDQLQLVEMMNSAKAPKVALDIPSGLDGDRGVVRGGAVKSHTTLTFGLAKPGFFVGHGPQMVGRLKNLAIGFPFEALRGVATTHFLFNEKLARRYLPRRGDTDNKSQHGRLMIVAGSRDTWGAGVLASHAAYRMGVGYVYWTSFESPLSQLAAVPEVMTGQIDDEKFWQKDFSAWVVGPGLGVSENTRRLLERLRERGVERVVVDADALTTAVQHRLFPFPESWVLTPHAGELSRILGVEARAIEADRFSFARQASEVTGCHVLLKGYRSVLAFKERCLVIGSGNSALAKAGTGDVLAGMIGALLAEGLETVQATATAAYIHGRLADDWLRKGFHRSTLLASDIQEDLPGLLSRLSSLSPL
jgi:ADP-dependent NAD(P)H-hydrate dehydratase / NAD(P)H-hydrate epimerase